MSNARQTFWVALSSLSFSVCLWVKHEMAANVSTLKTSYRSSKMGGASIK